MGLAERLRSLMQVLQRVPLGTHNGCPRKTVSKSFSQVHPADRSWFDSRTFASRLAAHACSRHKNIDRNKTQSMNIRLFFVDIVIYNFNHQRFDVGISPNSSCKNALLFGGRPRKSLRESISSRLPPQCKILSR